MPLPRIWSLLSELAYYRRRTTTLESSPLREYACSPSGKPERSTPHV